MPFKDLGLSELTIKAVNDMGYKTPTEIQSRAIPAVLAGSDVVGIAQTGTGKTGGFTLPMLDILSQGKAKARMPRSIILAPTRELATQIGESFVKYGKYHRLSMALLIGGESLTDQKRILDHGVDVLIATPGRMIDLFERGGVILTGIKILVIDEADRMLDMGFIPDVKKIISWIKIKHQTLLFSATMAKEIKEIAEKFMTSPQEIFATPPSSAAKTVDHSLIFTRDTASKRRILGEIINAQNVKNAMIFCNRKLDVARLYSILKDKRYSVCQLHGDMPQNVRTETIEAFRQGEYKLLVCSDVAARGLDLPDVSHVFLIDVPIKPEDYVHRIGRTGRAGKEGKAYTFVTEDDFKRLAAVEENLGKSVPLCEDFGNPEGFAAYRTLDKKHMHKAQKVRENPNKKRQPRASSATSAPSATSAAAGIPKPAKDDLSQSSPQRRHGKKGMAKAEARPRDNDRDDLNNPYLTPNSQRQDNRPRRSGSGGSGNPQKKDKAKAFGDYTPAFFGIKIK